MSTNLGAPQGAVTIGFLQLLAVLLGTGLVLRRVIKPLQEMNEKLVRLAKGETEFPLAETSRKDQIGDMAKAINIFRDNVLENKKLREEEIRKTQELEVANSTAQTANQAKSEFLSSMSHELRTPLNAILGFSQLMQSNPKEPLTQSQEDAVKHVIKGGEHLLDLINDVLDLSKIEAGKVSISFEHIYPNDVFKECKDLLGASAEERGITLNSKMETEYGIEADYTRLKQVLLNLMSNAIKYNRNGGSVIFGCADRGDQTVRVFVKDTGLGIPDDKQSDLFKPFNRLGQEVSEIEGTGIGLTLSKQLAELMGAEIGFETKANKGSTFWVDFPRSEQQTENGGIEKIDNTKVSVSEPNVPLATSSGVLYIEDNPANIALMEQIVGRIDNIELTTAHTAELGLEAVKSHIPDMIILDINLPGIDGYQALKEFRQRKETATVPIVALSAAATKKDIEKGLEAGFQGYLTKPIDVVELSKTILLFIKQNSLENR